MVKIKYSKLLKYPFLILLYTIIFCLFLLNFPKYISAGAEKENNESKVKIEYILLETKTDDDAQDIKDKEEDKEEDKEDKEDKIIEILDINVSSIGDLLNIEKIIKNYKVIAVIGFDEIIDLNYEKDIKQNKESVLTGKYPEFILNFWNNFKEFAALFN